MIWKPTIVILHGWGLKGSIFEPLEKSLATLGYKVYAPDLPGFGSEPPPVHPWKLEDYAKFLDEYVKQKRIKNPVLIGHSFGGRVSLKYQQLYPKNVRALILTGTPGFTPIPKKKLILFIVLAKIGGFLFSIPPLSLFQNVVRRWYYYVVGARDFFRAEGVMREIFKTIVREDLVSSMLAIRVPCIMIWGEIDIITPLSIAHRMKEVILNSQLQVIPASDHGVPYKEPGVFAKIVHRFLQSL